MNTTVIAFAIGFMFAALGALGIGIFSMAKGGDFNKKHGNKLMQARVILQGVAFALLALAYLSSKS